MFKIEMAKLFKDFRRRKQTLIELILRHEYLLRTELEKRMEGRRPRGRKGMMMMDNIEVKKSYEKIKSSAEDREEQQNNVMRDLP